MSDDKFPLLPDPPSYHEISGNQVSPVSKTIKSPPTYKFSHGVNNNFQIPKGCNLYWSSIFVHGRERKNVSIREKYLSRRRQWKGKEILHKVSGVAKAGRVLAIMGSSGAGKTTLLNVLTSRNLSGLNVQGSVTVDGQRVTKWKIREISAFVQQQDMFIGTMTAREHLRFMARLRMGSAFTKLEQDYRVEEVIRKILTCPKILFCDEPTSGLDAFMAGHVVAALRSLADGGMTVVITIHQPSSQVYSMFNDVCLMACGRIIYLGPAEEAEPLFESCGYPSPEYYNPADHLIRTLAIINGEKSTCLKTISVSPLSYLMDLIILLKHFFQRIRQGFLQTPYGKEVLEISSGQINEAKRRISEESNNSGKDHSFFNMKHPASFLAQLIALTWRSWLTIVRDPMVLKIRFIQTVICALITGFVYFGTPVTSDTVISINGILFNQIRNLNFMLQFPAVPAITLELPIVLRENSNGIYTVTSYFIGKNVAELPQYIVLPALYNVIVYWMAGLVPNIWTFLFATLISVLVSNVAISISYAVAIIFSSTDVAMTFLPIFVVPMLAFGGFFITYDAIPGYFTWLSKLSYFKYVYYLSNVIHVIQKTFQTLN
ncbi:ABC transporter, ATP-binding protein [Necator americanus]|uniref:ABC transporter, ATP-binding protein n=1 Tax=Necator americanus TaxID=51031 RepID=W2SKZ0_NECAM|nr:ABC transporter, ATP-binding protein [Necator americanus]ETN70324.1 ABC transporter, ATP-binding protein [Necator americanus]